MCSRRCMFSSSDRCQCECGGVFHGINRPPEERIKQLKKMFKTDWVLAGKQPAFRSMVWDYDGVNVSLYLKDGRVMVRNNACGKGFPLEFFEVIRGIPF